MSEWRQFKIKQREKRMAKPAKKGKGESKVVRDKIIVQRMSSEVYANRPTRICAV